MILNEIFARFVQQSPIPVALRATLERVLSPEKLDQWFDLNCDKQYTRKLLFSTVFELMSVVVFKVFPSINAAYQGKVETMGVSIAATYDKLNGFEPATSAALVRDTSEEMAGIIKGLKAECTPLLPGYRVKMLDGNCIEKSEHRLEVLRYTTAGPLPGKSLVVYDPSLDQAVDVFPCEDGHAQERSLLKEVSATIQANDVWVADRNFCVRDFLFGIDKADAFYVIRHHKQAPYETLDKMKLVGSTKTGKVYQQQVKITDSTEEEERIVRLIKIKLKKATRDGDKVIQILCNLPSADVDARQIAELYRKRWSIETMFQKLTLHLKSEIDTLAYPRAALFGFCIALVSYNLLSVVKGALRSVHGEEKIEEEVSAYYLAGEISRTTAGMEVALPAEEWIQFRDMPRIEFVRFLKRLMKNVNLSKYKKHKRGEKKPLPKRNKNPKTPHVSTFRLLNEKSG